jgi:hypothetical protein
LKRIEHGNNQGMREALTCPVCGDVIGVYEPVVALGSREARRTSLAGEPDAPARSDMILHAACASAEPQSEPSSHRA